MRGRIAVKAMLAIVKVELESSTGGFVDKKVGCSR